MPPKRKTAASAAQKIARLVKSEPVKEKTPEITEDVTIKEGEEDVKSPSVETTTAPTKRKHEDDNDDATSSAPKSGLADRLAKLKELKRRRATEVEQGNRRDRNLEFQRTKENPKFEEKNEKKKLEALKLLEKQEAKDAGEDYERKQFWKYSAESAASWEKKMEKKARAANNGFTGKFMITLKNIDV
ncbi:hypothetical protein INT47_000919 [Mucor saturninus]|uniref:Pre-mRNA-splicing factor SYF2 n=1 Tax=Mucor saturninus TaxID=64648 RepID=A0A8H7RRC3_9FUNG|nr:hypothetical protein INT47_000919 [Mucor saturninus]